MRRINFVALVATLLVSGGIRAQAPSESVAPPPVPKTKVELEAEALRAQRETEQQNLILMVIVGGAIAFPIVVAVWVMLTRKRPAPALDLDERAKLTLLPIRPSRFDEPVAQPAAPIARPERHLPEALPVDPPPGLSPGDVPGYFLVRATYRAKRHRMARIYVLPNELLVIDAGPNGDGGSAAGVGGSVFGGSAMGSVVGGAVASMVAEDRSASGDVVHQRLDRLDLAGLLECSKEEGNFSAPFEELAGIAIDPPGAGSFPRPSSRAVGTFRFRYLQHGEYTFEFVSPAEVRGAIGLLRLAAGDLVRVGTGWDDVTASYLTGL